MARRRGSYSTMANINITSLVDVTLTLLIIFMLTASIVGINFVTDIILALTDPRIRSSIVG